MIQRSLAAAVYNLFLLLTCDNWEAGFFWLFFSPADSLWFICPSSELPEGHQDQSQKTQAARHLFLLSVIFTILFCYLCHFSSFFSRLSFCLASTIGLALAGLPHHPLSIHHSCPHFIPLYVCIPFLLAVNWVQSFQQSLLHCSRVGPHHLSGLFNTEVGQLQRLFMNSGDVMNDI